MGPPNFLLNPPSGAVPPLSSVMTLSKSVPGIPDEDLYSEVFPSQQSRNITTARSNSSSSVDYKAATSRQGSSVIQIALTTHNKAKKVSKNPPVVLEEVSPIKNDISSEKDRMLSFFDGEDDDDDDGSALENDEESSDDAQSPHGM